MEQLGQVVELDPDTYFADPDDEPLYYMASSLDTGVATASISEEGMLTVKAVSQGVCTVLISAEDHAGAKVQQEVTVLVRPEGSPEVFLSGSTVISEGAVTIITGLQEAPTTAKLIHASGVVVYSYSGVHSAATPLSIQMDNLAPGIYTLEVTYNGQVYTYIIVKR